MMTGFQAYYTYYLVNSVFFTYKKNPIGLFFSEKNKIRDKCIDVWNEKHVNSDGILFMEVEKRFEPRILPQVFVSFKLYLDNNYPSRIISEEKEYVHMLARDAQDWQDILKRELPLIKNKQLLLKSSNIVTQAICYDIFGIRDKTTNSLEKEVHNRYRTKIKNVSLMLKHYWPREFETERVRRYIKTVIIKKEN